MAMQAQDAKRVSYEEAADIFERICMTYCSNPVNHEIMITAYTDALNAVGWTSDEFGDETAERICRRMQDEEHRALANGKETKR